MAPESFEIRRSKGMFIAKVNAIALWGAILSLTIMIGRFALADRQQIKNDIQAAASQAAAATQQVEQNRQIQDQQNEAIQRQLDDLKKSQAAMEDRIIRAIQGRQP